MKKKLILIIVIILTLFFVKNLFHSDKSKQEIIEVTKKPFVKTLYFSGKIEPIEASSVVSPVEGVVQKVLFHYGDAVQQDQILFVLSSSKLEEDFHNAIAEYVKAFSDYKDRERKFKASEHLLQLEFISKDDFYNDKNARDSSYLSMLQARYKLQQISKALGQDKDVSQYEQMEKEQIAQMLSQEGDEIIIRAKQAGIALWPQNQDSGKTQKAALDVSDEVKRDQVLVNIGNLTGLLINFTVDENTINELHIGQQVEVSCDSLPEMHLKANIRSIAAQAQTDLSSSALFGVSISTDHLPDTLKNKIRVGMNAKVSIVLNKGDQLVIPLKALLASDKPTVLRKRLKGVEKIEVETGPTNLEEVVIQSGLNSGDKLVIAD